MDASFKFYAFLLIGIYLVVMVVTGLWFGRREDTGDFTIGNRNIGLIPTAASLAASFRDGGGIVFWITAGFAASYSGLWLFVGIAGSAIILSIIGPKLRVESDKDGHITIQERVRDYLGPLSARLSTIVSLIFGILLIALQYHVTGNIFAEILGVPKIVGVTVVALILIAYIVTGGYKSVVVTDTIQFFIMFSLVIIPLLIHPSMVDITNVKSVTEIPFFDGLALVLFGLNYLLIAPECWQRIFSSRNDTTARWGVPLTVIVLIIMTLSLIWLGMGLKQVYPTINKASLYTQMFQDNAAIAPWVLGYILLVFVSITMSTQSAACYGFVSTLAKIFRREQTREAAAYVAFSRKGIVCALIVSAVLSLTVNKTVEYMFDIIGFVICLSPMYVLSAVASRLPSVAGLRDTSRAILDRVVAAVTALGILVFFAFVWAGVTNGGFIYSVIPWAGTAVLMILVVPLAMRKLNA